MKPRFLEFRLINESVLINAAHIMIIRPNYECSKGSEDAVEWGCKLVLSDGQELIVKEKFSDMAIEKK